MIRNTSVATYNAIRENGLLSKKRLEVYEFLFKHGPLTGSQVQLALRSKGSVSESVRNRITELVKMCAVCELGEVVDPVTGRKVILFDVTNRLPKEFKAPKSKSQIIKELRTGIISVCGKLEALRYEDAYSELFELCENITSGKI